MRNTVDDGFNCKHSISFFVFLLQQKAPLVRGYGIVG